MAKAGDKDAKTAGKRSKMPLLLGIGLALAGGGGGFYAVNSGLVPGLDSQGAGAYPAGGESASTQSAGTADVAYVPIAPLLISINDGSNTHLRFRAQLEVAKARKAEVEALMPRIVDVLNGYLHAVEVSDLRDNSALVRLRAQMLRRVQVVAGADRVADLLIMEFVMS